MVASPNVIAGTQALNTGGLTLHNGSGLASNYQFAASGNTGTISRATLDPLTASRAYDATDAFAANLFGSSGTITTAFGETLVLSGSGTSGEPPVVEWLLATALKPDGTGIIANDPRSGQQVILRYDASTKTIGAITAVFDPKTREWLAFDDANARQVTTNTKLSAGDFRALKGFIPTSYYAVTIR